MFINYPALTRIYSGCEAKFGHTLINLIGVIMILIFSSTALAMRCGTDLVLEGDSDISVLERCGKPLQKTEIFKPCAGLENGCRIERWAYRKGSRHFSMVYIQDGRVIEVKTEAR